MVARSSETRAPGLGFVVSTLSRRIIWSLAGRVSGSGVMPAQFPVLRCLREQRISTQGELSRLCGIEQSSMAVTLNRMEKGGLIDRQADDSDGRRKLITLTARGTSMLELMTREAHVVYQQAVDGLSDDEIRTFLRICEKMTANLER